MGSRLLTNPSAGKSGVGGERVVLIIMLEKSRKSPKAKFGVRAVSSKMRVDWRTAVSTVVLIAGAASLLGVRCAQTRHPHHGATDSGGAAAPAHLVDALAGNPGGVLRDCMVNGFFPLLLLR